MSNDTPNKPDATGGHGHVWSTDFGEQEKDEKFWDTPKDRAPAGTSNFPAANELDREQMEGEGSPFATPPEKPAEENAVEASDEGDDPDAWQDEEEERPENPPYEGYEYNDPVVTPATEPPGPVARKEVEDEDFDPDEDDFAGRAAYLRYRLMELYTDAYKAGERGWAEHVRNAVRELDLYRG